MECKYLIPEIHIDTLNIVYGQIVFEILCDAVKYGSVNSPAIHGENRYGI